MLNVYRLKIAPLFRRNLRPKHDTPNLLLKLPPELRNRIYELVLPRKPPAEPVFYYIEVNLQWKEPPLIRTSKQILHEALPMFYAINEFTVFAGNGMIDKVAQRLEKIVIPLCGPKPFSNFHIDMRGPLMDLLPYMLPFLEFIRSAGLELSTEAYELDAKDIPKAMTERLALDSSVFCTHKYGMVEQYIYEKALALARRAREESWTAERLESRFKHFVKQQQLRKGQVTTIYVEGKLL
jgi:hypothetical protein